MITILVLAGLVVLVVSTLIIYRRRLDKATKLTLDANLAENLSILSALGGLALLPALLSALLVMLAPWVVAAPRLILVLGFTALWGIAVARFWARRVVPVAALAPPAPPPTVPTFLPLPLLPPVTPLPDDEETAESDDAGFIQRTFRWTFTPRSGEAVNMAIDLTLDPDRFEAARAETRRPVGDWAHYALADMPELDQLALAFYQLHEGRDWSTLEQASNVLCFTQACITYRSDAETTPQDDWPRYPIETLVDGVGDCEDDVILAAAVLKRLGFEAALLYYPGHCALGVAGAAGLPGDFVIDRRTGVRYFYGETTATGWHLGEAPERYRGQSADPIEVLHRIVRDN